MTRSFRNHAWLLGADELGETVPQPVFGSVQTILRRRGLDSAEIARFLAPSFKNLPPDLYHLKDMRRATDRIEAALRGRERICVYGDYDADGTTSTALLMRFLRRIGGDVRYYIPERLTEGYGPNVPAVEQLAEAGVQMIVFVDAGTVAFEPIRRAQELGVDCIVVDHHTARDTLPDCPVVNPNRQDEDGRLGYLCAVGTTFLLVHALNVQLEKAGYYAQLGIERPRVIDYLDLVALGTVADVMALREINRTIVKNGLALIAQGRTPGMRALLDVCGIDGQVKAWHLGFLLGPHINAAGRIAHAGLGVELLTTDDEQEAVRIASELHNLNEERKALCETAIALATSVAEQEIERAIAAADVDVLEAEHPDWEVVKSLVVDLDGAHEGIIGIVAGRLKESFGRPCFVITFDENGDGKGSGRSVAGLDMGRAVMEAVEAGILVKGGGHPMAAGITIRCEQLDAFRSFLAERCSRLNGGTVQVDVAIGPGDLKPEACEQFATMEPFGAGNPEPRIAITGGRVTEVRIMKDVHLKLTLQGPRGITKALLFNALGTPLGDRLAESEGRYIDVVGKARTNAWNGRVNAELMIEDARLGGMELVLENEPAAAPAFG